MLQIYQSDFLKITYYYVFIGTLKKNFHVKPMSITQTECKDMYSMKLEFY